MILSGLQWRPCLGMPCACGCIFSCQLSAHALPTQDIAAWWDSIIKPVEYSVGLSQFAGPGSWADMDMLYGEGGLHGGGARRQRSAGCRAFFQALGRPALALLQPIARHPSTSLYW